MVIKNELYTQVYDNHFDFLPVCMYSSGYFFHISNSFRKKCSYERSSRCIYVIAFRSSSKIHTDAHTLTHVVLQYIYISISSLAYLNGIYYIQCLCVCISTCGGCLAIRRSWWQTDTEASYKCVWYMCVCLCACIYLYLYIPLYCLSFGWLATHSIRSFVSPLFEKVHYGSVTIIVYRHYNTFSIVAIGRCMIHHSFYFISVSIININWKCSCFLVLLIKPRVVLSISLCFDCSLCVFACWRDFSRRSNRNYCIGLASRIA